ncbi:uncharacterized protein V6R79_010338 [Siganus canaliculatus]
MTICYIRCAAALMQHGTRDRNTRSLVNDNVVFGTTTLGNEVKGKTRRTMVYHLYSATNLILADHFELNVHTGRINKTVVLVINMYSLHHLTAKIAEVNEDVEILVHFKTDHVLVHLP